MSICDISNSKKDATQECLDQNKLEVITFYRRDFRSQKKARIFAADRDMFYQYNLNSTSKNVVT